MMKGNYVFIRKDKIVIDDKHLVCLLRFVENEMPKVYIFASMVWNTPNEVFVDRNYDKPGQKSKPEFTFLSRRKKLGIRYWYTRANIDDEKLEALSNNLSDIRTVYIVDYSNAGTNGQYPEFLMKIQKKQKYSLFLQQCDGDYKNAILCAVFYEQNLDGAWAEVEFASGKLTDIDIIDGNLFFAGVKVDKILDRERTSFFKKQEIEKNRYGESVCLIWWSKEKECEFGTV